MRSSGGSEFQSETAVTANDLSPTVLALRLKGTRRRLLMDRKLYFDPDCPGQKAKREKKGKEGNAKENHDVNCNKM